VVGQGRKGYQGNRTIVQAISARLGGATEAIGVFDVWERLRPSCVSLRSRISGPSIRPAPTWESGTA
jgi:hypothetical protein